MVRPVWSAIRNSTSGAGARRVLARAALCMLLLLAGSCAEMGTPSASVSSGRFHDVQVYRPPQTATELVLLLSGDGGWSSGLSSIAARLAQRGALTAGIDSRELLEGAPEPGGCVSVAAELAALATELRRRYRLPDAPPLLIGHSAGATLAYVALAQSQPGTFAGALTLSFCEDLDLPAPLCPALPAAPRSRGVRLLPGASLPGPWIALHGLEDEECPAAQGREFAEHTPGTQFKGLAGITHSYRHMNRWWPEFAAAYEHLLRQAAHPAAAAP